MRPPERFEIGIVERAALAFRLGANHGAVEAGIERLVQNLRGELAALQRNRRQRRESLELLDAFEHVLIEKARPVGALLRRQLIGEHVEPAADHLLVDFLLDEPLLAMVDVAEPSDHRPRELAAAKRQRQCALVLLGLDRRKQPLLRLEVVEQRLRNVMSMHIDVHGGLTFLMLRQRMYRMRERAGYGRARPRVRLRSCRCEASFRRRCAPAARTP